MKKRARVLEAGMTVQKTLCIVSRGKKNRARVLSNEIILIAY